MTLGRLRRPQSHCEEGEARRGNPPQASRALARDLNIASSAMPPRNDVAFVDFAAPPRNDVESL